MNNKTALTVVRVIKWTFIGLILTFMVYAVAVQWGTDIDFTLR